MFELDELVYEVDFNARDADGNVFASMTFASSARVPAIGEWVRMEDGEGDKCGGAVLRVDAPTVVIAADMSTWTSTTVAETFAVA
jgi:hypothetical protein